jgi:DNA-binding GntR family transcriptional regulator
MNLTKKAAQLPTVSTTQTPAHEQVYLTLRGQILFGEMVPGQAVTIQGLTESLSAGMTPVREAIRRLISDGALNFQGNRRVSVPLLTKADVEELIFLRKTMEYELATRAARRLTPETIARLSRIDDALDVAIQTGDVVRYLSCNYDFHSLLYQQADAPVISGLTDRLWLRFGPSLRVVCGRFGTQNLPDRHKELLSALRQRDIVAAGKAVVEDVEQGMAQILAVIDAQS